MNFIKEIKAILRWILNIILTDREHSNLQNTGCHWTPTLRELSKVPFSPHFALTEDWELSVLEHENDSRLSVFSDWVKRIASQTFPGIAKWSRSENVNPLNDSINVSITDWLL